MLQILIRLSAAFRDSRSFSTSYDIHSLVRHFVTTQNMEIHEALHDGRKDTHRYETFTAFYCFTHSEVLVSLD